MKRAAFILGLVLATVLPLWGEITYPPQPGDRDFISDQAGLLSDSDEQALRKQLDKLLTEKAIPIVIVTIRSLKDYGAEGTPIETYARILYDHWGIGHKMVTVKGKGMGNSKDIEWNRGILLIISVGDRKARIELGGGFGHEKDDLCKQIMDNNIIPYFKKGDFPGGIKSGVKALEQMARDVKVQPPPRPWWHYALLVGAIVLTIFTIVSLIRRGTSGWAWLFWGVALGTLWWIVITVLSNSGSSSGFSGGSFGGGSSGGGGATGSW